MNKAMSISLAKIDYDLGEPYIKIIVDCPSSYEFTLFHITVHMMENGEWVTKYFDASKALVGQSNAPIVLPVSALPGVSGPAIYEIELKAEDQISYEEVFDKLVLSDVYYVYRDLLDGLLSSDRCDPLSDELIKKYLILYGHQQALQEDLDIAKELFKLLHKNFTKCGNNGRRIVNCGCHDRCR
jgi:hypothetical protein